MAAVAFLLESPLGLDQLARIKLPLRATAVGEEELDTEAAAALSPPPLPAHFQRLQSALERVTALASAELPLVAWVQDGGQLTVACAKALVVRVIKLLHAQQQALGIALAGSAKDSIDLQPMSSQELGRVCSLAVAAALRQRGWAALGEAHLLGGSLLALADGMAHTLDSVQLRAEAAPGSKSSAITLLLQAEVVKFRHPAARSAECSMEELQRQLCVGGYCTVLPDFRPGLIMGVQPADPATLEMLRPLWASYGLPLPATLPYLVSVCFNDDPDAACFPYPPCCVLSQSGLEPVASRLVNAAVQTVLARVRDDLAQTTFKFWGGGNLKLKGARVWHPEGLTPALAHQRQADAQAQALPADPFCSARELAKQQASKPAAGAAAVPGDPGLALGEAINISGFAAEAAGSGRIAAGGGVAVQQKKEHARAGAALTGYLQKRQLEEAASAPPKKAAPLPAPKPAPPRLPAGEPGKPAVPTFKSTAPPKPAAAAKRQGGTKPPAAPRAPKAAKPARPAAAAAAAAEGPAGSPEADGTGAAAAVQAIEHVTSAMAGGGEGAPVGAEGGAKPAKPRAPPKELVLEEVVKKVLACQATGKLSSLTIPEMKCYLKSVKKPVGGKKAELEERVRQALGAEA